MSRKAATGIGAKAGITKGRQGAAGRAVPGPKRKSVQTHPKTTPAKAARPAARARPAKAAPGLPRASKQDQVIEALRRPDGATLVDLMLLTGWQAHTVRGTMSGVLRKKLGLAVTLGSADSSGTRRYRITSEAGA